MKSIQLFVLALALLTGSPLRAQPNQGMPTKPRVRVLNAAFVCVEDVDNSELMAPYDVLQHSFYRDSTSYIRCFIVTPDGEPFTTFEGIRITPDYSFENAPPVDILVIPSTKTSG